MAKCSGITRAGTACRGTPIDGSEWCYVHHPDHAEERRRHGVRGGKRGGRGRPVVEISALKGQLSDLYHAVLEGRVEPKVAAVAAQVANVRTRLVETELKVREQRELEERLALLESALERRSEGGRQWG